MNRLRPVLALGLLAVAANLHAAATPAGRTEDLGQGLTYVLPSADTARSIALFKAVASGPAVLDLRYFSSAGHATDWLAVIKGFATPQHVCLVLVSPETSPGLAIGLASGIPNCITISRISTAIKADIAVNTTAEIDRKAWESIGKGADIDKLITSVLDNPRYDEAVLAKEHAAEVNGAAASSDDSADSDDTPSDAPKKEPVAPAKPKPLTDAVLQRAVQIDRALLALRKL